MKQNHKTFLTRKRWIGLIVLILATIFTAIYACKTNIDPAPATIAGSFGSIAALLLISYILKVRDDLFFCGLLFVYFASPVGSVLNLYRSVDLYDKVVHFFSGLLLASLGAMIMSVLLKHAVQTIKKTKWYTCLLRQPLHFSFPLPSQGSGKFSNSLQIGLLEEICSEAWSIP